MSSRTFAPISKTTADPTQWDPYPLPAETIISGEPNAKVHWLRTSGPEERGYYSGVWTVDICKFNYVFEMDETAHILEGRVTVSEENGPTLELGPGDVASFPKGAVTVWDIKEPLKKVFVDTE
jgi:uncharacterized cupin superfamily protein